MAEGGGSNGGMSRDRVRLVERVVFARPVWLPHPGRISGLVQLREIDSIPTRAGLPPSLDLFHQDRN